MTATATLSRRRLQLSDLTRLSTVGLRTRKLRAGLSALGIAIGVAAIVAVLGLPPPPRPACSTRSTSSAPTY